MRIGHKDAILCGEAARILGVSVQRVRYLANRGTLGRMRIAGITVYSRKQVEKRAADRREAKHLALSEARVRKAAVGAGS